MMNSIGMNSIGNTSFKWEPQRKSATSSKFENFTEQGTSYANVNARKSMTIGSMNSLLSTTKINSSSIPTLDAEYWPTEIPDLTEEYGAEIYCTDTKTYYAKMVELGIFTPEYANYSLEMEAIWDRKIAEASRLGTVMYATGQTIPHEYSIFYIKGDDGKDKILAQFGDEQELLIDVPEGFDMYDLDRYMKENLTNLVDKYDLNQTHYNSSELKKIFEDFLLEMFE